MLPTVAVFGSLCVLEYLFWLTPIKQLLDKISLRGAAFYLFPVHYWIRILMTLALVLLLRPAIHSPFAGSWVSSLMMGVVVCLLSLVAFRVSILRMIDGVRFSSSPQYWKHTAYILVYPSLIEELLFRWLLVSWLWAFIGWWTALVAPAINIMWHLPVWIFSLRADGAVVWRQVFDVASRGLILAIILTVIYVVTQNVIGVVIAHAFGDWVNVTVQYQQKKSGQQGLG